MHPPTALLLTWSGDHFNPDRVAEGLARRGVRPVRVDTDLFPTELVLRWSLGAGGLRVSGGGPLDGVDPAQVVGVWWRKMWSPRLPEDLDPAHVVACTREIHATNMGLYPSFLAARHVNDPWAERRAEDKLLQLRLAAGLGLRCPETLITNDAEAVRDLWDRYDGAIITKMLTPYSRSMAGDGAFVYTSRVGAEDLEALDGLSLCPMVFQEEIPRAREHRVVWTDGRIFAGHLDTAGIDGADWRAEADLGWRESQVPDQVAAKLGALMGRLGLVHGAFDLMETPDGDWVFLEVNPSGEWGMLERDLALPIGDAIAEALVGGTR